MTEPDTPAVNSQPTRRSSRVVRAFTAARDRVRSVRARMALVSGRWLAAIPGIWVYLALALGVAAWTSAGFWTDRSHHISSATYDRMIGLRLWSPAPDPAIAILDIDERSLALMSAEFGRWPWPREVLASALDDLERQGAAAVVFDILFSDPDTRNPGSERAFSDAVTRSRAAYFPVLRLDQGNDKTSQLTLSQLPGLVMPTPAPLSADDTSIALTLPYFDAVLRTTRLGTFNVNPDSDGVVRRYRLWEPIDGTRLMSLPARVAVELGWGLPASGGPSFRLNWPAPTDTYRTISFADYYQDTQRQVRTRADNEFRNTIVIIGATAPALGDIKATPAKRLHPGVEILATAIDGLHTDRLLREIPKVWQYAIAVLLLALMTWTTIRFSHDKLSWAFVAAPGAMLALSYLSLNVGGWFGNVFLDLSAPASMAFLFYSLAKLYNMHLRQYWAGENLYRRPAAGGNGRWNGVIAADLGPVRQNGRELKLFGTMHRHAGHATMMLQPAGTMGWIARSWEGVILIAWDEAADDASGIARAQKEADAVAAELSEKFSARVSKLMDGSGEQALRGLCATAMAGLGSRPSAAGILPTMTQAVG